VSKKDLLNWYESLGDDVEFKREDNKNEFAILLNTLMMQREITKSELAKRYGKKLSYISRVLRGDENLTTSCMTKLLDAIGCNLHISAYHNDEGFSAPEIFSADSGIAQFQGYDQEKTSAANLWAERGSNHDHEAA